MTAATSVAPVTDEQLRIRGLRIHAQIRGEGEPLLLFSGIWGEVGLWEQLLPHLRGFRTIAFDPPGIGRSQRPPYPLSMWSLAQMGAAVLDAFGIESAHVLGASFGGAVAQQMAFSHPRRVRRLVLVSTSFGGGAMPGNLRSFWHFIHPRSYHPERLERVADICSAGGCAPSRRSSARCTSGARRTPGPPCIGWPGFSAGPACPGCGPSASPP